MKIIQLNIWGGKLGQQVINFLKAENPDIVCLQEVNDLKGRSGYKFFATLDEIKEGAGFSNAFMSPTFSMRYMEREMSYGNAILSKFPIENSETIFTNLDFKANFDMTLDDGNIRNFQIAEINTKTKKLTVLNHHGYHIKTTKDGDEETFRQMKLIAEKISDLNGPIILCGDLNLTPNSSSIEVLNQKLTNLSLANNLKSTYGQLSIVDEVCDYIFVNDQVKVKSFKMSNELVSDHKALILEFDL